MADSIHAAHALVLAAAAQVLLTAAVGLRLFLTRSRAMRNGRVHPQAVATSTRLAARLDDAPAVQAADNFRNLFEVPVLFFALVAVALATTRADAVLATLAWAFVVLRAVHSTIHCGGNRVMRRFAAFAAAAAVLLAGWGWLAWRVVQAP